MLSPKNRQLHFITLGLCLSLLGLFCALYWELIVNRFAEKSLVLRPNSKYTKFWEKPPMLLRYDFYLFNWTNSEVFDNASIKPKLEEIGPYSFLEIPEKYNIKWHSENSTVSYRRRSRYYFDEINSGGSLNDTVVAINSLAVAIATKFKRLNTFQRMAADIALRLYHDNIALQKTVDEMLFTGFEDTFMSFAGSLPPTLSQVEVPFDKFGYLYPRNSSYYGHDYNVNTGADDIRKIGQINFWNHQNSTDYYASQCARVKGSAGEFQAPYLKKYGSVEIFVPEFCRPMKLDYKEEVVVEGILGYKYIGSLRSIDNGTLYPENFCHCNGNCMPSGVINVTSCWFGHTLFISYPHFYNADSLYAEQFNGMQPDKNLHELYIVLEPRSSVVLDVRARIQTNLYLDPPTSLRLFRSNRSIMFPLMWVDGGTRITPALAAELKAIYSYVRYGQIFGTICCIFGLLISTWLFVRLYCIKKSQQSILDSKVQYAHEDQMKQCSLIKQMPDDSLIIEGKTPNIYRDCIQKPSTPYSLRMSNDLTFSSLDDDTIHIT